MSYAPSGNVHSNLLGIAFEHFLGAAALANSMESKFTLPHDRPRTLIDKNVEARNFIWKAGYPVGDGNISK